MGIRDEAYDIHFSKLPDENDLAQRLDEAFDISFGDQHRELSFWIADPKPHTRERFGLRHDGVLVVYSKYSSTDARVLRTVNEISDDPRYRHRLDPVLSLLIHCGDPAATIDLIRSDPDRVIVPFTSNELRDPGKGTLFVRLRIASHFGDIDLFGMSSPLISDRYFFGRDDLVQEIVVRATSRNENSGLFGLRKTGKTSILRAVERRISGRPILVEYIDCHNPGIHAARWWQVLENIVERLVARLSRTRRRNARVTLQYSEVNAGIRFSSDIQSIAADGELEHVLLMFDEVEFITPQISGELSRHWDKDFVPFWQTIRSVHQETLGNLVFLVAGVNPRCVQEPRFADLPNPIFQLAPPYFLEPFTRGDVRNMVRSIGRYSGLNFDERVYDYLSSRYGGHPFLIRIVCSEVWRNTAIDDPHERVRISVDNFDRCETEIRNRLAQPIKDILLSLVWWYPEEYDLLQILAVGDSRFVEEYINENPGSLVQFARYGILRGGSGADFAIVDLKQFLNEHGEDYKQEISPFLRGDMPPELLPEVPNLETLGKLFKKRCEAEIKLRRVIIMYLGVKSNWDPKRMSDAILSGLNPRPDRPDPRALFVGRSPQEVINQVYMLELKSIIGAHWDTFGPLFESNKTRFEMNMDTINLARRVDAHTQPLTPAQIEDFNNSYGWLLRKLENVPGI